MLHRRWKLNPFSWKRNPSDPEDEMDLESLLALEGIEEASASSSNEGLSRKLLKEEAPTKASKKVKAKAKTSKKVRAKAETQKKVEAKAETQKKVASKKSKKKTAISVADENNRSLKTMAKKKARRGGKKAARKGGKRTVARKRGRGVRKGMHARIARMQAARLRVGGKAVTVSQYQKWATAARKAKMGVVAYLRKKLGKKVAAAGGKGRRKPLSKIKASRRRRARRAARRGRR